MTAAHPLPPAADDLEVEAEVIVVTRDGIEGIVLDPEEEAETVRREAEIPELERQGLIRPIGELLADVRAEIRQRRAG
jgi:hypothetical protein